MDPLLAGNQGALPEDMQSIVYSFDDELTSTDSINDELMVKLDELLSSEVKKRIYALHRFALLFPTLSGDTKTQLLSKLQQLLYKEEEKDVKNLAIILLEKLILDQSIDRGKILDNLINQCCKERSNSTEIKCRIYESIHDILKIENINFHPSSINMLQLLCVQASNDLTDLHYSIRSVCIGLLSTLLPIINMMETKGGQNNLNALEFLNEIQIQKMIHRFGEDPDPRVRTAAIRAFLHLHQRGCKLDLSLYNLVLSTIYPQEMRNYVLDDGAIQNIRLLDDAFTKICDMVNDRSVKVRSKACTIMGSYHQVDESILLETLSQEIITHGKSWKPITGHSKSKKPRFIPTPEGDLDVESAELRILKSSACGAFIHGLEDAYQDVRNAAIDSMCQLCVHNEKFSKRSVEFLVDMFQDEIDFVRLNSIKSLHKIGTQYPIELDSELLQITLSVLNDADPMVRESTHGMLGVAKLKSSDLIPIFIKSLLASMARYPEDQLSIYQCFGHVGSTHGDYIERFVPKFFKMESSYISKEINQNAPEHVGHLILAFNASISNPKILSMLPAYTSRHYEYLRIKFPQCFPDVKFPGETPKQSAQSANNDEHIQLFMENTIKAVLELEHLFRVRDFKAALRSIKCCKSNLKYISHVPMFSGNAKFFLKYLECIKALIKIKQSYMGVNSINSETDTAVNLLTLSYVMEYGFLGLESSARQFLGHELLMDETCRIQKKLTQVTMEPTITNITSLFDYILDFNILEIGFNNAVKCSEATIIRPVSNPNPAPPIDFQSQFPLTINVEAEVNNVDDTNTLAVQITLPDQSIQHFRPSPADLVATQPNNYQLKTQIDISQSAWTGPSYIQLKVVRDFQPDIPDLDLDKHIMRTESTLDLSDSIEFYIWPKDSSNWVRA
ncbi:333_t:CDS:10 [Dentiscutata heterogama]|uniref:333_t:CDS:1 n=1 Tax=Dentiscutata heterogama TaxID=1316150 RepID=A0ACA9K555_9GLOM|nr:333_t:CDS:10 [Dentiscutata heterogama]